jgi:NAD(P)H-hydrate epimerase
VDLPNPTTAVPALPARAATLHKGQAGHVAVVAGSRGMSGAAVLCGWGALRGGAGLVRVYCPTSTQAIVASSEPSLMTVGLPEDADGRLTCEGVSARVDLAWPTVLAIGPGLGQALALPDLIALLLRQFPGPTVLDADGLNNAAALGARLWESRASLPTVVTPHPGEMARLRRAAGLPELSGRDEETRLQSAHEYAVRTGFTVVLKGHRTVVCAPTEAYVNQTGNPGMATGGMGDVLTGLIAALLAQGLPAFDAARLGVYVHGLAADRCAQQIAPVGYLAREVAEALPGALAEQSRPRIGFH